MTKSSPQEQQKGKWIKDGPGLLQEAIPSPRTLLCNSTSDIQGIHSSITNHVWVYLVICGHFHVYWWLSPGHQSRNLEFPISLSHCPLTLLSTPLLGGVVTKAILHCPPCRIFTQALTCFIDLSLFFSSFLIPGVIPLPFPSRNYLVFQDFIQWLRT